jgi:hypothetical protein
MCPSLNVTKSASDLPRPLVRLFFILQVLHRPRRRKVWERVSRVRVSTGWSVSAGRTLPIETRKLSNLLAHGEVGCKRDKVLHFCFFASKSFTAAHVNLYSHVGTSCIGWNFVGRASEVRKPVAVQVERPNKNQERSASASSNNIGLDDTILCLLSTHSGCANLP